MSLHEPLDAEREAQAQELAARIRARADSDILALARAYWSARATPRYSAIPNSRPGTSSITSGAAALEERLKKSSATKDPASTALGVSAPRSSKGTARKPR